MGIEIKAVKCDKMMWDVAINGVCFGELPSLRTKAAAIQQAAEFIDAMLYEHGPGWFIATNQDLTERQMHLVAQGIIDRECGGTPALSYV